MSDLIPVVLIGSGVALTGIALGGALVRRYRNKPKVAEEVEKTENISPRYTGFSLRPVSYTGARPTPNYAPRLTPKMVEPTYTYPSSSTYTEPDTSNSLLTGVLLGELMSERPQFYAPDSSPVVDSFVGFGGGDSNGGGASSSWGDSPASASSYDSCSSSSYDSGSSGSFDSGSCSYDSGSSSSSDF